MLGNRTTMNFTHHVLSSQDYANDSGAGFERFIMQQRQ
jgi:hypothetical protein